MNKFDKMYESFMDKRKPLKGKPDLTSNLDEVQRWDTSKTTSNKISELKQYNLKFVDDGDDEYYIEGKKKDLIEFLKNVYNYDDYELVTHGHISEK